MTQNWAMPRPPALIAVNIDHADANKNYRCDLTLLGDARQVAGDLLAALPPQPPRPGARERIQQVNRQVTESVQAEDPAAGQFLDALERVLPDDAVVVVDMCIPGYWVGGYRRVPQPRKLAYPVGWGTLGFGFPASIGAAFARSGRTVCVTGDGGFLFGCGELATLAQHQLALSVVVVDDGGYGMLRFDQQHAGDAPFGVDLLTPDFAALAHAFGVPARTVDGFGGAFERELTAALAADGPRMVVVKARLTPPVTTSPRWYRHRKG
jgi:acetolactate synthase-1/2/3 large subunit